MLAFEKLKCPDNFYSKLATGKRSDTNLTSNFLSSVDVFFLLVLQLSQWGEEPVFLITIMGELNLLTMLAEKVICC